MSFALRNRVVLLALIILVGQLTLVVHATVHDAEYSCQLCLSQSHYSKGIPSSKLTIPATNNHDVLIVEYQNLQPTINLPNAYFQRAPPVTD